VDSNGVAETIDGIIGASRKILTRSGIEERVKTTGSKF
jgi:hypothetical protein